MLTATFSASHANLHKQQMLGWTVISSFCGDFKINQYPNWVPQQTRENDLYYSPLAPVPPLVSP